jgi:hypothetical protein
MGVYSGLKPKIKFPPLHKGGQHEAFYSPARFKILVCGRRWGKTLVACLALIFTAFEGGYCWWVWPTFTSIGPGWNKIISLLEPLMKAKVVTLEKGTKTFKFPSGGFIQFKSAEKAASLRGEGLDLVVVDEWAYCMRPYLMWESDLKPALSEKQGKAMLISTPNGMDHVFEYFHHAKKDDLYEAWQFPSWTNPFIPKEEFEAAKKSVELGTMPKDIFDQEYGAEFISGGASYFRNVKNIMTAEVQTEPIEGHSYRAALDWGRSGDGTVLGILDMDLTPEQCVQIYRIPSERFTFQHNEILRHLSDWGVDLLIPDATGLGLGPSERLQEDADCNVELFTYTTKSKVELFSNLQSAYELGQMLIPGGPDFEWLKTEHEMMVPEVKPGSLHVTINARSGFNDDGPNMCALLNRARNQPVVTMSAGGI